MTSTPLGTAIGTAPPYRPENDIIGDVVDAPNGENQSLRIGRTRPGGGWEQVAFVTLTPDERRTLADRLLQGLPG
jgi:hypothetical protein